MTPRLRELLTDLKAAALIGHPDSLQTALDGVRALDDDQLPPSALLPLGRALTSLPADALPPLLHDPDPAIRALAAVALGERYMLGADLSPDDLHHPAADPNPEVRAALARALTEFIPPQRGKLEPLVNAWLRHNPPPHPAANGGKEGGSRKQTEIDKGAALRTSHTALFLLPHLPTPPLDRLNPFDAVEDHGIRDALVACLTALAEKGHAAPVLDLLSEWAARPKPNVWIITRTLSASWAQNHAAQATRTLRALAAQTGMIRPIIRTLERFG